MRIAHICLGLAILTSSSVALAQPAIATSPNADAQARALFFDARVRANSGDHAAAVQLIDRAITLLGGRKRRMMPVLIDSLQQLERYGRAAREASTYLAMQPVIKSREYKRIAALLGPLRNQAVEHERKQAELTRKRAQDTRAADDSAWSQAQRNRAAHDYRYYLQRFPNGLHAAEARTQLDAAKRREDQAQLDRQRQQQLQREKYARERKQRELRNKVANELRKDAKAIKSGASVYYIGGIVAIVAGGSVAVLMQDDGPRAIGGVAVLGGALLLYLGQSKINRSKRMMREADDIQNNRKPLPAGVSVAPWLGPTRSYGLALGGRF